MSYKRKEKLTLELINPEVGQAIQGKYIGKTTRDWTDPQDGEIKPLTTVVFQKLNSTDRFGFFQDAGLRNAMEQSLVKEGDYVELVKLEKVPMSGGRSVNQWDIFALE